MFGILEAEFYWHSDLEGKPKFTWQNTVIKTQRHLCPGMQRRWHVKAVDCEGGVESFLLRMEAGVSCLARSQS